MLDLGYTIGRYSPCLTYHRQGDIVNLFHGDDLVFAGEASAVHTIMQALAKHFQLKVTIVGEHEEPEARIRNRVVQGHPEGWSYAAD